MAINRKVASLILLAALDYKAGDRSKASKSLQTASEDPDFDETLDGLADVADEKSDPFLNPEQAGDDDADGDDSAGDGDAAADDEDDDSQLNGLDELLNEQSASLARRAKKRQTAAEDDKIGGNDGPTGADVDNNSDEEIRQEASVARLRQVRANLIALANVR